jgi:hypothetical protein
MRHEIFLPLFWCCRYLIVLNTLHSGNDIFGGNAGIIGSGI